MFIRYRKTGELQRFSPGLLDRLHVVSDDLGQIYAFVGDGERAIGAIERAHEERAGSRSVLSMKVNPGYDFIRDDPRFVELMERVGLQL